jgi:Phosphoribosyl transferase domain
VSQWTAHHLGLPSVVAEHGKERGYDPRAAQPGPLRPPFVLKRGYDRLVAGKRVLVVDDVINTGESVAETGAAVEAAGGEVVTVAASVAATPTPRRCGATITSGWLRWRFRAGRRPTASSVAEARRSTHGSHAGPTSWRLGGPGSAGIDSRCARASREPGQAAGRSPPARSSRRRAASLLERATHCPKRRIALQRPRAGGGLRAPDAPVVEAPDPARRQDHQRGVLGMVRQRLPDRKQRVVVAQHSAAAAVITRMSNAPEATGCSPTAARAGGSTPRLAAAARRSRLGRRRCVRGRNHRE